MLRPKKFRFTTGKEAIELVMDSINSFFVGLNCVAQWSK